jgi:hypothetical protein
MAFFTTVAECAGSHHSCCSHRTHTQPCNLHDQGVSERQWHFTTPILSACSPLTSPSLLSLCINDWRPLASNSPCNLDDEGDACCQGINSRTCKLCRPTLLLLLCAHPAISMTRGIHAAMASFMRLAKCNAAVAFLRIKTLSHVHDSVHSCNIPRNKQTMHQQTQQTLF